MKRRLFISVTRIRDHSHWSKYQRKAKYVPYREPVTPEEYLSLVLPEGENYPVTPQDAEDVVNVSFKTCRLSRDGQTVALAGAYFMRTDVVTAWVRIGAKATEKPIKLVKWFKRMLKAFTEEYPSIHRIEAHCIPDHPKYRKLIELCGFQYEGLMRKGLTTEHDLLLFSLLPKEDKW